MREILDRIRAAQVAVREKAAADGCGPAVVHQVGVEAGEKVVVEHLKEIEAEVTQEDIDSKEHWAHNNPIARAFTRKYGRPASVFFVDMFVIQEPLVVWYELDQRTMRWGLNYNDNATRKRCKPFTARATYQTARPYKPINRR